MMGACITYQKHEARSWKACQGLGLLLLFCASSLWGTGQQESDSSPEKPKINFYGFLQDETRQQACPVKNITINGRYKEIPFYAVPLQEDQDPAKNPTFIDLAQIKRLETVRSVQGPVEPKLFNKRRFVAVIVTLVQAEPNTACHNRTYLLEATTRIICQEDGTQENLPQRKPLIEAVTSLEVTGYKEQTELPKTQKKQLDDDRTTKCVQANTTLKDLEAAAQKNNDPVLHKKIAEAKDIIGTLCSTTGTTSKS